ncbi:MAG: hypothetical protein RR869_00340 [Lachnospiraceae bacterium]
MLDFTAILGIVILGSGLYCLYAAYMLKTKGVINKTILLGKNMDVKKCKDKQGYIDCVFPKVLVLGIVATVYSAIDLINSYVTEIMAVWYVGMVVFLVVLIWFGITTSKAARTYFGA